MMRLLSLKQYMKMSKPALIRKITKSLRMMPKVKLARLCYNITKSKLPQLRTIRQKRLTSSQKQSLKRIRDWDKPIRKRKTKRKFSRKQLAAQRLFAKRARAGTLRRR